MLKRIHQCASRAIRLLTVFSSANIHFNMTPDLKMGLTPASSEVITSSDQSQDSIEGSESESLTDSGKNKNF